MALMKSVQQRERGRKETATSPSRTTTTNASRSSSNSFLLPQSVQQATGKQSLGGAEYFALKKSTNNFQSFNRAASTTGSSSGAGEATANITSTATQESTPGVNGQIFVDDKNRSQMGAALSIIEGRNPNADVKSLREKYGLSEGPQNMVATSEATKRDEKQIGQDITAFQNQIGIQPTAMDGLSDILAIGQQTQRMLDERGGALDDRYDRREQDINQSFDGEEQILGDKQEREFAGFQTGLQRIGGYLGGNTSAMGALVSLKRNHQIELASLESKRQESLNEAFESYTDGNFELAKSSLANAKSMAESVKEAKDTYFNQSMALAQEQRTRDQQEYTRSKDEKEWSYKVADKQLDLALASGKDLGDEQTLAMSRELGVSPQVLESAMEAKRNTLALEKEDRLVGRELQIMSLLQQVPAGTYVTIGGKQYAGMRVAAATGGGSGGGSGGGLAGFKDGFEQDLRNGMPYSEALRTYGSELGSSYIKGFYDADAAAFRAENIKTYKVPVKNKDGVVTGIDLYDYNNTEYQSALNAYKGGKGSTMQVPKYKYFQKIRKATKTVVAPPPKKSDYLVGK